MAKAWSAELVMIEAADSAIVGRITSVKLPERDRLTVEPSMEARRDAHPIGLVQLLSTVSLRSGEATPGIGSFPRVGAGVYTAHPAIIRYVAEYALGNENATRLTMNIAQVPAMGGLPINLTPEKIFGRHCAILGATGAGKSWTIARVVESVIGTNGKIILFDATGEYHGMTTATEHYHLGTGNVLPITSTEAVVPYTAMSQNELFAMFRPAAGSQGPKLREAIRSLKLARVAPHLAPLGVVVKSNREKQPIEAAMQQNLAVVEADGADFDIEHLVGQIEHECCWQSAQNNPALWGGPNATDLSYCTSLMNRISSMINAPELACVFKPRNKISVFDAIEQFIGDDAKQVLRISLKLLPFSFNTREIVANAIAKRLLALARSGRFATRPTVVVVDEAHNFLSKEIGDEFSRCALDGFESIAREGRKFALTICLATQRPRDLTESVLSQMGAMIVHRLTNSHDRDVIERSAGDLDRSAASFLPTLAPGEALLIGSDFPFPLTIQIIAPTTKPDSSGPDFQQHWAVPAAVPQTPRVGLLADF